MMRAARTRLWILLPAGALLAAGVWVLYSAQPGEGLNFLACPLLQYTGVYCAGCGITRTLQFALHGQFYAALRMNPLAMILLPVLAAFLGVCAWRILRRRPLPDLPAWVPWAALALIVGFTVARNLPWEPFSWLAPTLVPVSWVR